MVEEKAKKAMLDAAKIAEELRYEQENAQVRQDFVFAATQQVTFYPLVP